MLSRALAEARIAWQSYYTQEIDNILHFYTYRRQ